MELGCEEAAGLWRCRCAAQAARIAGLPDHQLARYGLPRPVVVQQVLQDVPRCPVDAIDLHHAPKRHLHAPMEA